MGDMWWDGLAAVFDDGHNVWGFCRWEIFSEGAIRWSSNLHLNITNCELLFIRGRRMVISLINFMNTVFRNVLGMKERNFPTVDFNILSLLVLITNAFSLTSLNYLWELPFGTIIWTSSMLLNNNLFCQLCKQPFNCCLLKMQLNFWRIFAHAWTTRGALEGAFNSHCVCLANKCRYNCGAVKWFIPN